MSDLSSPRTKIFGISVQSNGIQRNRKQIFRPWNYLTGMDGKYVDGMTMKGKNAVSLGSSTQWKKLRRGTYFKDY